MWYSIETRLFLKVKLLVINQTSSSYLIYFLGTSQLTNIWVGNRWVVKINRAFNFIDEIKKKSEIIFKKGSKINRMDKNGK